MEIAEFFVLIKNRIPLFWSKSYQYASNMSTKFKTICDWYICLKAKMEELAVILAETQSSLKVVSPETAPVHKAFKKLSKDNQAIICWPKAIMFQAANTDKAISRRQVGDKAQIVVDEDSKLEIEGLVYIHLLWWGKDGLLQGTMSLRVWARQDSLLRRLYPKVHQRIR